MLNFYRRFLHRIASNQAPLHDVFPAPNSNVPILSPGPTLTTAFIERMASLSQAALLAHRDPSAQLALVTDVSTNAMGAILQQLVQDAWQPLAFSRKLIPAQQKYSAYERALLAIYESVKYFQHMLEVRHFTVLLTSLHLPPEEGQVFTAPV